MPNQIFNCPHCGSPCDRDEVDVEVGVMYGPWGCASCSPEYDCRAGIRRDGDDRDGGSHHVDRIDGQAVLARANVDDRGVTKAWAVQPIVMGCRKCLAPPGSDCMWATGPRDVAVIFHAIRARDATAARDLLAGPRPTPAEITSHQHAALLKRWHEIVVKKH